MFQAVVYAVLIDVCCDIFRSSLGFRYGIAHGDAMAGRFHMFGAMVIPFLIIALAYGRKGFKGPAGEFVGKVALRQSVSGKNFVIADILGDWSQAPVEKGDVIFSE